MTGVVVNSIAIVLGSVFGLLFKRIFSEAIARRTEQALGFCILVLGIKMAFQSQQPLLMVACVSLGGMIGTWADIEGRTDQLASSIQGRFKAIKNRGFATGFSTTSILFCTGAMAVVGSINSAILGNHDVLFAKALLDGILSISLAAIYGFGVAFSALPVLLYQGGIAMAASKLEVLSAPHVLAEISGTGGILLAMIGVSLSGIKRIPVGDFLPAIPLAILAAAIFAS